jgi:hypothetical protein
MLPFIICPCLFVSFDIWLRHCVHVCVYAVLCDHVHVYKREIIRVGVGAHARAYACTRGVLVGAA